MDLDLGTREAAKGPVARRHHHTTDGFRLCGSFAQARSAPSKSGVPGWEICSTLIQGARRCLAKSLGKKLVSPGEKGTVSALTRWSHEFFEWEVPLRVISFIPLLPTPSFYS